MPFDPAQPIANSPNSSQVMRDQLNALKTLVDAGVPGPQGPPGADGADGADGEVTFSDLVAERINHAANPTGVASLGLIVSDPPTQSEMQAVVDKMDELLAALRRAPV